MASRRHSAAERARLPAQRCRWCARCLHDSETGPSAARPAPPLAHLQPARPHGETHLSGRDAAQPRDKLIRLIRYLNQAATCRLTYLHAVLRNKTKKNASYCVKRHASLQQTLQPRASLQRACQLLLRPAVAGRSIVARSERGRRNASHGEQIDKPTRSENVMHGKPHHRHAEQR